jgi:hypothetical protein
MWTVHLRTVHKSPAAPPVVRGLKLKAIRCPDLESGSATSLRCYGFFTQPTLNQVFSESPVAANSEAWNPALLGQLVNRGRMDMEYLADFLYCQDFIVACHDALILLKLGTIVSLRLRNSRAAKTAGIYGLQPPAAPVTGNIFQRCIRIFCTLMSCEVTARSNAAGPS